MMENDCQRKRCGKTEQLGPWLTRPQRQLVPPLQLAIHPTGFNFIDSWPLSGLGTPLHAAQSSVKQIRGCYCGLAPQHSVAVNLCRALHYGFQPTATSVKN